MKTRLILISLFLTIVLSACSFSLAEDIPPPPGSEARLPVTAQPTAVAASFYPVVPPDPAQGAAIYAEKCAPCHGETGKGDGPSAADLSMPVAPLGEAQFARQRSPAKWFAIVTNGNIERFMPPFAGSLTERQRWDVVAYAFSLSETQEQIAQGEALYEAHCAACHGEAGKGDGPQSSALPVAPGDFTNLERMADKSAAELADSIRQGVGEAMPAFEGQFSEEEVWALTAYIRTMGYASSEQTASAAETPVESEAATSADDDKTQTENAGVSVGTVQVWLRDERGNPVAGDFPVTLYAFDNMQFVESATLNESEEGLYRFENVAMPPERAFLSSVNYKGVVYGSDVAVASDPEKPIELVITVFETTTDTSALMVDRLHIFFDFSIPENVQVVELYVIRNMSNRTVVAAEEDGPVVRFNLPIGASNLQFEDGALGERYILTEQGFADTQPIRAGADNHQVVFAYTLPYPRKLTFTQPQSLAVNSAVILVPEGVKLRGEKLVDEGLRDMQGASYQMYTMGSLPAGKLINLEISGKPKSAGATSLDTQTSLMIGIGALGLALIVAGVWLYRRERMQPADEEEFEEESEQIVEEDEPEPDPEQLMDAIIALDDLYKAGELPEEAYRQRRAELKAQLEQVLGKP